MGNVELKIIQPQNNQNFVGTRRVRFEGAPISPPPVQLFYRWYSNNWPANPLTVPLGTTLNFEAPDLVIGSQAITLGAKDVAGDSKNDLPNVKHGGMAGGLPGVAPAPCLIHVVVADMLLPSANGATLSKANSILIAQAPPQWANQEYQSTTNKLQFRWLFAPTPADGRKSAEIVEGMIFDQPGVPPNDAPGAVARLRYQGPLPAQLGTGNYRLTLLVERKDDPAVADELSRNVVLTA
ncbi:MAG TPA: hypothetical protein VJZ26_14525 [Blastocatellia bacterium]|nr:hypothetical protein [Blastocatellia bacterium]